MSHVSPSMTQLIDEFLTQDLSQRNTVEAVILCGSQATGRATVHSDIDLCYIGDFTEFQRETIVFANHEFQLMIAPWTWYEGVIEEYERKSNVGTITTMLAIGRIIWGKVEKWQSLHRLAKGCYNAGPEAATEADKRKIRQRITTLWKEFVDADINNQRKWLALHLVQACVEGHFTLRGWWAVKPKYQLEELNAKDVYMASLVEKFLNDQGAVDKTVVQAMCEWVLEPVGGWMNESWKV